MFFVRWNILQIGRTSLFSVTLLHPIKTATSVESYVSPRDFDFVSATMPLFGLIGTIIGLIAMFDSLGSDVTVESLSPQLALALKTTLYGAIFSSFYKIIGTRFERRMVDLDYDYDTFCRALQVIVENKNKIEID